MDFHCVSAGKESACNAGDLYLIPVLGRSPREEKGYPLQYSGLENSMDYIVHGLQEDGHDWVTFIYLSNMEHILVMTWLKGDGKDTFYNVITCAEEKNDISFIMCNLA